MKSTVSYEEVFARLCSSDCLRQGRPNLLMEHRKLVARLLTDVIASWDRLRGHILWIRGERKRLRSPLYHTEAVTEEQALKVLTEGLEALGHQELALLALNPVALQELHDRVGQWLFRDDLHHAWHEATARSGARIAIANGLRRPEEIIAELRRP